MRSNYHIVIVKDTSIAKRDFAENDLNYYGIPDQSFKEVPKLEGYALQEMARQAREILAKKTRANAKPEKDVIEAWRKSPESSHIRLRKMDKPNSLTEVVEHPKSIKSLARNSCRLFNNKL